MEVRPGAYPRLKHIKFSITALETVIANMLKLAIYRKLKMLLAFCHKIRINGIGANFLAKLVI